MNLSPASQLLPARMLNEFVYCPRLFYYEFVEGVFVHNADTLEGKSGHRRVDTGGSGLPAKSSPNDSDSARAEPELIHSRSVQLYSEQLGVTAKLDLVETRREGEDLFSSVTTVTPVEYKKGKPREGEDGVEIWDTDRMQLGLQILLLRDNNYPCEQGVLYYRETRQRVTLDMTPDVEQWIRDTIAAARTCTTGPIPPPLSHSAKCPRCSLVSICLPDETNYIDDLRPRAAPPVKQLGLFADEPEPTEQPPSGADIVQNTQEPDRLDWGPFAKLPEIRITPPTPPENLRRLIAPNADTKALYLNTPGQWVGKKGETLTIKEEKKVIGEVRLNDLHHLAIFGPVQLSTSVVQTLCERDIPLTWFTLGGWFYGMTRGHSLKNVFTRIEQFQTASQPDAALQHARLFVYGKIRNQRTLLMRNHNHAPKGILKALKHLAQAALYTHSLPTLLGIEGQAAAFYFAHFSGMIKQNEEPATDPNQPEFTFRIDHRNRRPPRDPVNALLSLLYSLLAKDCTIAAYATGFDPYVGFLHQPRFGRPALALDLMEEFRPLIADSTALTLLNNRMLNQNDFLYAGKSVNLTPKARKQVYHAYEKRLANTITHPTFGYKVSYRRALELQSRLLAKCLTGEIEQYLPFTTR